MSLDPETDRLRATSNHAFASRPLGSMLDEDGFPLYKEHNEFADAIRIAVEIILKRWKSAGTPALREANGLCFQFWRDCATNKVELWKNAREAASIIFGNPPRTNIVLARMFDWQDWRTTPKGRFCRYTYRFGKRVMKTERKVQKAIDYLAQSEMRAALEEAWTGLILGDPGQRSGETKGSLFMAPATA